MTEDLEIIEYTKTIPGTEQTKTEKYKKILTSPGKDFGHCSKCCFFSFYKCDPCCDAPFNDERFSGCYSDGFIFEKLT